jgi:hypothetical protein
VKYTKCQYVMYDILYVLNAHVVILIHAKSLMAAYLLASYADIILFVTSSRSFEAVTLHGSMFPI